jgi:hypothetical protein
MRPAVPYAYRYEEVVEEKVDRYGSACKSSPLTVCYLNMSSIEAPGILDTMERFTVYLTKTEQYVTFSGLPHTSLLAGKIGFGRVLLVPVEWMLLQTLYACGWFACVVPQHLVELSNHWKSILSGNPQGVEATQHGILYWLLNVSDRAKTVELILHVESDCRGSPSDAIDQIYTSVIDTNPDAWSELMFLACVHMSCRLFGAGLWSNLLTRLRVHTRCSDTAFSVIAAVLYSVCVRVVEGSPPVFRPTHQIRQPEPTLIALIPLYEHESGCSVDFTLLLLRESLYAIMYILLCSEILCSKCADNFHAELCSVLRNSVYEPLVPLVQHRPDYGMVIISFCPIHDHQNGSHTFESLALLPQLHAGVQSVKCCATSIRSHMYSLQRDGDLRQSEKLENVLSSIVLETIARVLPLSLKHN